VCNQTDAIDPKPTSPPANKAPLCSFANPQAVSNQSIDGKQNGKQASDPTTGTK
jgi:hypothetical protein